MSLVLQVLRRFYYGTHKHTHIILPKDRKFYPVYSIEFAV